MIAGSSPGINIVNTANTANTAGQLADNSCLACSATQQYLQIMKIHWERCGREFWDFVDCNSNSNE